MTHRWDVGAACPSPRRARTSPWPACCIALQARWSSLNLTTPVQSALPGRHLLPNATGDFDALAKVMASTHQLVDMWAAYGIVQAFTLLLLVARCGTTPCLALLGAHRKAAHRAICRSL